MQQTELVSPSVFIQVIDKTIERFQQQKAFLEQACSQPELLFQDAHRVIGSKRDHIYQIMNQWNDGKRILQVHDFQKFMAELLNRFVQQWAKEHGIHQEVVVKVRNPNTFPSIFAVYHGDIELIQFDILKRFYGIRDAIKSEEEINEERKKFENERNEQIERCKNEIAEYVKMKESPFAYVWNYHRNHKPKNWFRGLINEVGEYFFLVFKRRKMLTLIDEAIKSRQTSISSYEDNIKRVDWNEKIRISKARAELTEKLKSLFEQYGYRLETERYNLY